jgi:hypothetical protein
MKICPDCDKPTDTREYGIGIHIFSKEISEPRTQCCESEYWIECDDDHVELALRYKRRYGKYPTMITNIIKPI